MLDSHMALILGLEPTLYWREASLCYLCSPTKNNLNVVCCCFNISGSVQTLFVFSQVFAIIREVDNPQLFTLEFVRGTTKKFMSTDRYIKGNES